MRLVPPVIRFIFASNQSVHGTNKRVSDESRSVRSSVCNSYRVDTDRDVGMKLNATEIEGKGRGLTTDAPIYSGEIIEIAPLGLVPIGDDPYSLPWVFPWDFGDNAIAFGKISLCNHSYTPNCRWEIDDRDMTVKLIANRDIGPGEELTISYNCKLWFEVA